jgi:diguanylate cyclase (GGDEF)-like protein
MKVLICEDDLDARQLLERTVSAAGHSCTTTSSAREALTLISDSSFDVLLTDWCMPEMDGIELCEAVRSDSRSADTYVIVVTAKSASKDLAYALRSGADDFISKDNCSCELPARLIAAERNRSLYLAARQREEELARCYEQLAERSKRDALTGLLNRDAMEKALSALDGNRRSETVGFVLLDIDYFKKFNDCYGHQAGDRLLHEFAKLLADTVRDDDRVYRYGGEEFLILSRVDDEAGLQELGERIREAVYAADEDHAASPLGVVTTSIGLCLHRPGDSTRQSLERADMALYQAKDAGRNAVALSSLARAHTLKVIGEHDWGFRLRQIGAQAQTIGHSH